jgi:replicative DNA helicase
LGEGAGRSVIVSLKGVRKAQVKLATWYLLHGDEASAREVFRDMRKGLEGADIVMMLYRDSYYKAKEENRREVENFEDVETA